MKILLIEDDPDIRELVSLILQVKLLAKVTQAATVQEGLQSLNDSTSFDLIFSDYHLPDGTGGMIYLASQALNSSIPFLLCSTEKPENCVELKNKKIAGFIQKPFDTTSVVTQTRQALGSLSSSPIPEDPAEYLPISLKIFLKINVLYCDLFIKLSDSKFIRLAKAGDTFGKEDFQNYQSRKLDNLYVRKTDSGKFVEHFSKDVLSLSQAKSLPEQEAFEKAEQNFQVLQYAISSLGFTSEVQDLTRSCTSLAIRCILNDPVAQPLFQKILSKKGNFLSTHSILLVQLSCYLAHLIGWNSETTRYKLALASFLHDITLSDETLANLELADRNNPTDSSSLRSIFEQHPLDAEKLVLSMKNIPTEVDFILRTHHERPDGSGFPNKLTAAQIEPLASLFIVAHDLTIYFWMRGTSATLNEFLNIYANDYKNHYFKKLISQLTASGKTVTL